ncbi:DUF6503 family protein [Algoriphagus aquimarinus]|uniref:Deoxyribose-phosphate aldolase n=1 Tax=Algoriphagus aquimarinus TaxID=237018 RepID=A0A1I0X712_9BACT|nr:DUF6503 family protein [Algoriphagus aquimarinus]SFA96795.1 hypothetical protein SAMN04489723_10320 [Algoriphagus aquimarinus]
MRLQYLFVFLCGLTVFASCNSRTEAEKIVDKAIEAHGGDIYNNSKVEFDFRKIHYTIYKTADRFEYIREFSDSTGNVKDLLNNEGFVRTVNGAKIDTLSEEWTGKYSRSVNSVAYFAFLPYGLNDPSVFKTSLGETEINGEKYDLIKVTFAEEGGGDDFDDVFLYWIGADDSIIDFMAYSYHTDGGGVRMREVSAVQEVGGIRFQNYLNLKPADESLPVEKMQELYEAGELELLSEINLENITVKSLNK